METGRARRATTILPFGLCGQAVLATLLLTQPITKRLGVVPAHVHNGMLVALLPARVLPRILWVPSYECSLFFIVTPATLCFFRFGPVIGVLDEAPELADGHFKIAQVEGVGDLNVVARLFL